MVQYALGMDESGPVEIWTEGPKFTSLKYTEPESSKRGNAITSKPNVFFRYANGVLWNRSRSRRALARTFSARRAR